MGKKRVSLTVEDNLLKRIDRSSDRENLNRSRFVEQALESYFEARELDTAVVLCGDEEAKTLREYEGRPVLRYVLENLSDQGISKGIMLTGGNEEVKSMFGSSLNGMSLEYISNTGAEGSARELAQLEEQIEESFVVVNGHVITNVDLVEMSRKHRDNDSLVTMALTTVQNPSEYGVARMKGDRILGFEEKPEEGEEPSQLINAGTYVVEPTIFSYLDADSLEEVFEELASKSLLSGYIYGGKWKDVTSLE